MGKAKYKEIITTLSVFFYLEKVLIMIKIKSLKLMEKYLLQVVFDDGKIVDYDVNEYIEILPRYNDLKNIPGLFRQVQLDDSRTCVYWNDYIDLPSDIIYEYGKENINAKI